ncbi:hypothetical protein POF51_20215 [Brevibacillus sp. AG]|uniref:hypothetical protein n=1 Tax=Brevibacillus sp. AG TaxID=3020891 RepID=UPI00232D3380|nr:hypothetical protein [Brevibacillus sp. AG]MDC0763046.1 hypothetical protein [Brevibacillus sp. AG]
MQDIRKHAKKVTVFDDYCEIVTKDGKLVRIDKHEMQNSSFTKLDELILFEDTISDYGVKTYEKIRNNGLDDVNEVSKNTGTDIEKIIELKKHLFLEKHQIPKAGGILIKTEYFSPDDEIAYLWSLAQKREFTEEQKAWFKQLLDHELKERDLMMGKEGKKPEPYRRLDSWSDTLEQFTGNPKGAHEKAPPQPDYGTFPGFDPSKYY